MKNLDHYVMTVVDKKGLTDELRASFTGLNAWCRENIPGCISERIVFAEPEDADTVGICSCIVFDSVESKEAFRASEVHNAHKERVSSIVLKKAVYDL